MMNKQIQKFLTAGILLTSSFLFVGCKYGGESSSENVENEGASDSSVVVEPESEVPLLSDIEDPINLVASNPEYDKKTKSYFFKVEVLHAPKDGKMEFYLCDAFDANKIVATSKDGRFSNVKASTNDAHTYVVGIILNGGKIQEAEKVVSGFVPIITIDSSNKLTVGDVQKMLNDEDVSLYSNPGIAPDVSFKVINLSKEDIIPKDFSEILSKLKMEIWESVSVTAVDYDDNNRIKTVSLKVNYGE